MREAQPGAIRLPDGAKQKEKLNELEASIQNLAQRVKALEEKGNKK